MKKALAVLLALVLSLSVCTVALAKNEHHFNFGWEKPSFDFDYDFDFDFDDDRDDDRDDDHHQKPATPTDAPQKPDHDSQKPQKPDHNGQRPDDVPQRPEGGTCHPGDENCPDRVTDTDVTGTDIKDIFDAIKHMKDKGHHGKGFRLPKSNDKFFIIGMIITEDGTVEFIFIEKGKEDKGPQRLPANNTVTDTDVTPTDVPEGMDFIVMGDTDVDGRVSAKDALEILKHSVKKVVMEHEGKQFLADINEDGVIDARDALKALRKAVGKED